MVLIEAILSIQKLLSSSSSSFSLSSLSLGFCFLIILFFSIFTSFLIGWDSLPMMFSTICRFFFQRFNDRLKVMCVKLAPRFLKIKILTIVPGSEFVLHCSKAILSSCYKSFFNKIEEMIFFASTFFLKNQTISSRYRLF